ncbi:MAG: cysteine desulfurase family protein [Flavobacteriaceae bacterium]
MKVYFDNAATTPLRKEIITSMTDLMNQSYGNPSSTHTFGRKAKTVLENSRREIANHFNVSSKEIIFTSGGTESDNMILRSAVETYGIETIVTSKIEHHAVLNVVEYLSTKNIKIEYVKINQDGSININNLESILESDNSKKLVSLMHVNNEIGNILDLQNVSKICKKNSCLFHTDAVQSVGHYEIDLNKIPVDFLSASAHKFHGPKGIGFSFIRNTSKLKPFIIGGGQEWGARAGTESVYNVVGMSTALTIAYENLEIESKHIKNIKLYFVKKLKELFPDVIFNGNSQGFDKNTYTIVNVAIPIIPHKIDLLNFHLDLKGIACSKGSACQSGSSTGSHVINHLRKNNKWPSLRFSFSIFNSIDEVDYLMKTLKSFVKETVS